MAISKRCYQHTKTLLTLQTRCISVSTTLFSKKHYKLVVAGAGSGGSAIANSFAKKLGNGNVAVIDPSKLHYYQPMFTLIGAGIKTFDQCHRQTSEVLSTNGLTWLQDKVNKMEPAKNVVHLTNGDCITYDYLVIATGMEARYDIIKGALDALENDLSVVSNYNFKYVQKTFPGFQNFMGGNAIFTHPSGALKCGGAPQKIMYLFDDYLRKNKLRKNARINFYTALGVTFPVEKYAKRLNKICDKRDLHRYYQMNLMEVDHKNKKATFQNLKEKDEMVTIKYDFLHISPSFTPYKEVANSEGISQDGTGWVTVDKSTLQHTKFDNIFALGDCCNAPTSKTAAAITGQIGTVTSNLSALMKGEKPNVASYDGYTSCPLITSYNTCIMAEFDYNLQPKETFHVDQGKERKSMFLMKAHLMPQLYWHGLVKGIWYGPNKYRWITNPLKR